MIDFDDIDNWSPKLFKALKDHISADVAAALAVHEHEEDAHTMLKLLFELADRDAIIDNTLAWLRSETIVAYHGTRLIDAEVASVLATGLLPLSVVGRRERLIRALSKHSDWDRFAPNLDATINSKGLGASEGQRCEGKVYLTLSRSGLTDSFNHYISHGAEFDQGVVHKLMGEEGLDLLARDGKPRLVRVGVPGGRALEGAHPYFDIETTRDREAAPNLVKEFLGAWTSRFANPEYQSRSIKLDCGMIFWEKVPNNWIIKIETLPD